MFTPETQPLLKPKLPSNMTITNEQMTDNITVAESPSEDPTLSSTSNGKHALDFKLLTQIAIFNIGSHYNYHALSSLSEQILSKFNTTRFGYGALFSSEELATVLLCVGSLALVYTPLPPVALALTLSVLLSTALSTYAITISVPPSYSLLIASRFLFGFTQGLLTVVQGAILAYKFPHRLGLSYGVMLLTSRLSSFAGLTLPATLAARFGLSFSMWFAVTTTIPPVIAAFFFYLRQNHTPDVLTNASSTSEESTNFITLDWTQLSSNLSTSFPLAFWYCCLLWVVFSGVVYTLLHFSVDILSPMFHISAAQASLFSSILMLIAGLASPFIGYYQDRLHNRPQILLICSTLLSFGSLFQIIALHRQSLVHHITYVVLSFILMSIAFAAGPVTLMACVASVVPARAMPAALALYKATESAGLAILHVAFGSLRDWSKNYVYSLSMLTVLGFFGIVVAWSLRRKMPATTFEPIPDEQSF